MLKKFSNFVAEDLNMVLDQQPSKAGEEAKKRHLTHVGFGRYEDKSGQVTHMVQDDKLVPFKKVVKTNTYKTGSADDIGTYSAMMAQPAAELGAALAKHYGVEHYGEDELTAVQNFTQTGYHDINTKLNGLKPGIGGYRLQPDFDGDPTPQMVKLMDSAVSKRETPDNMWVYSKLGDDMASNMYNPGTQITFKGFRSTSIHPGVPINLPAGVNPGGRKQTSIFQIMVPKGSKGMYADHISATPGEHEFILPRASKIRILEGPNKVMGTNPTVNARGQDIYYYNAELVNEEKGKK